MSKIQQISIGLAVTGALAIVALAPLATPVNAATFDDTTINVAVGGTLSISGNQDSRNFNLTPTDTTQVTDTINPTLTETLITTTNGANGYSVSAKTSTTDGSLTKTGTGAGGPIASTAAGATLSNNSWGVKFGAGNYVHLTGTDSATGITSSEPGSASTTATYSAQVNSSVAADSYSTKITYTISDN